MSNNLFNSKNLWIDAETARILGIDSHKKVYINGDKVYVNHFYSDNIEFSIPLFALRAEQLYKLLSTKNSDAFAFRVFSNFKENTSRMFSENYESIELLATSNRILEESKQMNEEKRIDIFFENNELSSQKITKSMSKKIKKMVDKKKMLENKISQLEIELKKQLFRQINSSNVSIDLDNENHEKIEENNDIIIVEDKLIKEVDDKKTDVILEASVIEPTKQENVIELIKEENIDSIILDNSLKNEENVELKSSEEVVSKTNDQKEDESKIEDVKLNMDVEEEIISESINSNEINDYETQSIENIDKSYYSKECLKIEKNILKNKQKIQKIQNKISSIVGKEAKSPAEFREIYNKASAELENIKAKAKVAEKLSIEEFNKVKPYVVADLHGLVFTCYKAMCEANTIFDDSVEMFAKLILLIKRNLSLFDNIKK